MINGTDSMVNLAQYNDVNSFGITSMREVEELNKSLTAGYDYPPATGGGALRVESLEQSLKILTFQAKHCAFWQRVPKIPAYSTVEEFNQLINYGSNQGAFTLEGQLPNTNDSSYQRQVELVKFLGTTRRVTHQMTLVRTMIGDVVARENTNGILWILKSLEWALFNGDATMCYNGNVSGTSHREGAEFNGLGAQVDSTMIIDMAGAVLDEASIEAASQMLASNYAMPTNMFLSFGAHSAFSKSYYGNQRIMLPNQAVNGGYTVGTPIKTVATPFGEVELNPDVFLNSGINPPTTIPAPSQGPSTGGGLYSAPDSPVLALAETPLAGTDGVFGSHGCPAAGATYQWKVTACNLTGESLPSAAVSETVTTAALAAANHVAMTITNSATMSVAPEYFNIYKTLPGGSVFYLVGRIQAGSQSASGVTTWNDTGILMANTSNAFMGEFSPEVISVKQLAPLMKMDLATLDPSIRWMILIYLTFILYAPKKWVKFINVGN